MPKSTFKLYLSSYSRYQRHETLEAVLKFPGIISLACNLVHSSMGKSAHLLRMEPDPIRLVDAMSWLIGIEGGDLSVFARRCLAA
ncbi:hypothetical protein ACYOEI_03790 [Singulisphaera rosea]